MKFKITHKTTYEYLETVPVCHNQVHLTPRNSPWQECTYHRVNVKPSPAGISRQTDYFGNAMTFFSILQAHRRLSVTAISKVSVAERPPREAGESPDWQSVSESLRSDPSHKGLEAYQFSFESPLIPYLAELRDYARPSFPAGRPIAAGLADLTARIHRDFTYDPKATTVSTPTAEVFEKKRGVCQDLAHVQIGCLRSLGLAARYVSGYLRTVPPPGKPRLVGADASHAWVSLFAGPWGWIDADPTNDVLPGSDHITLAWGRDYADVAPIRGMFVGGGHQSLSVSVDVLPLDEPQPAIS